jgi:hypothetical protein
MGGEEGGRLKKAKKESLERLSANVNIFPWKGQASPVQL